MSCGCNQSRDWSIPRAVYSGEAYRVIRITKNGTRQLWAWSNFKDGGQHAELARAHKDTKDVVIEPEEQYARKANT